MDESEDILAKLTALKKEREKSHKVSNKRKYYVRCYLS